MRNVPLQSVWLLDASTVLCSPVLIVGGSASGGVAPSSPTAEPNVSVWPVWLAMSMVIVRSGDTLRGSGTAGVSGGVGISAGAVSSLPPQPGSNVVAGTSASVAALTSMRLRPSWNGCCGVWMDIGNDFRRGGQMERSHPQACRCALVAGGSCSQAVPNPQGVQFVT